MDSKGKSLRKRVRRELKPFLREGLRGLDELKLLDDSIPASIVEIADEMLAAKKWYFFFVSRRYKKFASSLASHNDEVRPIIQGLDDVSIDRLLGNPTLINQEELNDLGVLSRKARQFTIPNNSPYRKKVDDIGFFISRYGTILAQYECYSTLLDIEKEITGSGYILKKRWIALLRKETEARSKIVSIWKPYYPYDRFAPVGEMLRIHNEAIIEKASKDEIFDTINGISLDDDQRKAAVAQERNNLVIAGAGSGKTTTICGRVQYLLKRKGVRPSDILLLSYSKKSAEDLAAKMKSIDADLKVGTFHKIGLDILKENSGKVFDVEEQWDAIIEQYFRDELRKDSDALRRVLNYYALYFHEDQDNKKYKNQGEMFADLKKEDFRTLKGILLNASNDPNGKETIKKERVKSYEELAIANFYFINGIEYEYEKPYAYKVSNFSRRQYKPDFYLKDYDIYHEHYGIDKNGRAKQYDGPTEAEYLQGITWKRQCHQLNHTVCLETTSAEMQNGTLFESLTAKLKKAGVKFRPLSDRAIGEALDSIYNGRSFHSFINLVKSFLSLYKARYENADAFEDLKNANFATRYGKARAVLFLTICKSIYSFYMDRIRKDDRIDFDDMILQSMKVLPGLNGYRYKHIIVDEFQDISYSRMLFLKALVEHGSSSLFAVGDDWQSIYRFSGCDVNILLNFESYFGEGDRFFIGNVHRNSQELQDAASRFVTRNPEQIKKRIRAYKHLENPIRVIYYDDECAALDKALGMIAKAQKDAHVLLLGRNNKDLDSFLDDRFTARFRANEKPVCSSTKYPQLKITYSTVHGSKGLEEDYVILLSAEDCPNGFPNKTEDDPLLNLVMSAPSKYLYAEERRLWYVALTRTRSFTLILVPADKPSVFIEEMKQDLMVVNPSMVEDQEGKIECPRCKGGHLSLRRNERGLFYSCSNYPYCRYTIDDLKAVAINERCPECGDFLVLRHNKYGHYFKGCHNYPKCEYIKPED